MDLSDRKLPHPNTMKLTAFSGEKAVDEAEILSVGGGDIVIVGEAAAGEPDI